MRVPLIGPGTPRSGTPSPLHTVTPRQVDSSSRGGVNPLRAFTHMLVTYLITSHLLEPHQAVLATIGSLLPDIDHPSSLASRLLLGSLEALTRAPVRRTVSRRLTHRGALHCPWLWLLGALLTWPHHRLLSAILLGGFLHTVQDMLTARGVPVLPKPGGWCRLSLTPIPAQYWDYLLTPLALLLLIEEHRSGVITHPTAPTFPASSPPLRL